MYRFIFSMLRDVYHGISRRFLARALRSDETIRACTWNNTRAYWQVLIQTHQGTLYIAHMYQESIIHRHRVRASRSDLSCDMPEDAQYRLCDVPGSQYPGIAITTCTSSRSHASILFPRIHWGRIIWQQQAQVETQASVVEPIVPQAHSLYLAYIADQAVVIDIYHLDIFTELVDTIRIPLSPCLLDQSDSCNIYIGIARRVQEGYLITYHDTNKAGCDIYALVIDADNPGYLVWHDTLAVGSAQSSACSQYLGGTVADDGMYHLWWDACTQTISETGIHNPFGRARANLPHPHLVKYEGNPIIRPRAGSGWESLATYNPTAFVDGDTVHILYRAQGDTWESTLGWATSANGFDIDYRHPVPIYHRRHTEEGVTGAQTDMDFTRFQGQPMVGSDGSAGASWGSGGVEDCRVTVIGNRLYNVYAAFNGYKDTCVAMSSIDLADFRAQRFDRWAWPMLLTQPARFGGDGTKAGVLFPEQIQGQYAFMFRYFPSIHLAYNDSLDFNGSDRVLRTHSTIGPSSRNWDVFYGHEGLGPPHYWDAYKLGPGGSPIKTSRGWLMIYQGFGLGDDFGRYRAGAMLVDIDNPSRVIARSRVPVLDADRSYEQHGLKPHVIYPCGTVVKDGQLVVYYGACDETTCVASAPLEQFVDELIAASKGGTYYKQYTIN